MDGSTETSVRHRVSQAWVHFMARKSQFCNRRIPLAKRICRLRDTVLRTLLFGAGGWAMCSKCEGLITACELSMWRLMLARSLPAGVSQGEHVHNLNRKVLELRMSWNMPSWLMDVKRLVLGWWGHVVRHPSLFSEMCSWRDRAWAAMNRRIKYARAGPQQHAHDEVEKFLGDTWKDAAQDRKTWSLASSYVLKDIFGASGPSFLHISNKLRDWLLGGVVLKRVPVLQLTDSATVAQQASGCWEADHLYAHFLRWSHHCLGCFFGFDGVRWVEREENSAADQLAELAHRVGTSEWFAFPGTLSTWKGWCSRAMGPAGSVSALAVLASGWRPAALGTSWLINSLPWASAMP
jgi:hypothetical protein